MPNNLTSIMEDKQRIKTLFDALNPDEQEKLKRISNVDLGDVESAYSIAEEFIEKVQNSSIGIENQLEAMLGRKIDASEYADSNLSEIEKKMLKPFVFLSWASCDKDEAKSVYMFLATELESEGIETIWSEIDFPDIAGQKHTDAEEDIITHDNCLCVVGCITVGYVNSPNAERERAIANNYKNEFFIPLIMDKTALKIAEDKEKPYDETGIPWDFLTFEASKEKLKNKILKKRYENRKAAQKV